jgi:hypothetical protein
VAQDLVRVYLHEGVLFARVKWYIFRSVGLLIFIEIVTRVVNINPRVLLPLVELLVLFLRFAVLVLLLFIAWNRHLLLLLCLSGLLVGTYFQRAIWGFIGLAELD